jgi:lipoic acid synthetase
MVVERKLPPWLKVKMPGGPIYLEVRNQLKSAELHTVCEEAHCPNIGECWERRSATFMILGDVCTRACRYCAVTSGRPGELDHLEPERLARTVASMQLRYCVITSVDRDDLVDGGASVFAESIKNISHLSASCNVEVLIPDFQGRWQDLQTVLSARPSVLNHNIETVRRIFPLVRPKGSYDLSLNLLRQSKEFAPDIPTKSGIMVGLGEKMEEVQQTMSDLRNVGCDLLTIGQYLRPSSKHITMDRFYHPTEFTELRDAGLRMGFRHVASGPLVRSSYHADEQHQIASAGLAL